MAEHVNLRGVSCSPASLLRFVHLFLFPFHAMFRSSPHLHVFKNNFSHLLRCFSPDQLVRVLGPQDWELSNNWECWKAVFFVVLLKLTLQNERDLLTRMSSRTWLCVWTSPPVNFFHCHGPLDSVPPCPGYLNSWILDFNLGAWCQWVSFFYSRWRAARVTELYCLRN